MGIDSERSSELRTPKERAEYLEKLSIIQAIKTGKEAGRITTRFTQNDVTATLIQISGELDESPEGLAHLDIKRLRQAYKALFGSDFTTAA